MSHKSIDLEQVLDHAVQWALGCGEIINEHLLKSYEKPLKVFSKGSQGVTTQADLSSEKYVISQIRKTYPHHKILSEEDSFIRRQKLSKESSDEFLWLIDPLDGTNNFFNKIPFYCVSMALLHGQETLIGVVYNPVQGELFYAIKNQGSFLLRFIEDRPVHLKLDCFSLEKKMTEAILSVNLLSKKNKDKYTLPQVRAIRRLGSAALEMCYVAAGRLDAYWEYDLKPWDMGASLLICQEAGVKVSEIHHEKCSPFSPSILVAPPKLHRKLKKIINN
jgi:myo-inositol-1(or 4)-monophosphatase